MTERRAGTNSTSRRVQRRTKRRKNPFIMPFLISFGIAFLFVMSGYGNLFDDFKASSSEQNTDSQIDTLVDMHSVHLSQALLPLEFNLKINDKTIPMLSQAETEVDRNSDHENIISLNLNKVKELLSALIKDTDILSSSAASDDRSEVTGDEGNKQIQAIISLMAKYENIKDSGIWTIDKELLLNKAKSYFPPPSPIKDNARRIDMTTTWPKLDEQATVSAILESLSQRLLEETSDSNNDEDSFNDEDSIEIEAVTRDASITEAPWLQKRFPLRMSHFVTLLDPEVVDRTHNLSLASQAVNGTLVPPMGKFSFNRTVGERSYSAGYRDAPVLVKGQLVQGAAGGICQVSTTIYNAALLAGMGIVKRYPHSAYFDEFAYVPQGMDSAVAWDYLDLVVSNPYKCWLLVQAETVENTTYISIYGSEQPFPVEVEPYDLMMIDYSVKRTKTSRLKPGTSRVSRPGVNGYNVRTIRRIRKSTGWIEEKLSSDRYSNYPELIEYGG